jgi:hypothetical protein
MQLLQEYNQYRSDDEEIDQDVIFDTERDHYQVMSIGWQGKRRIHHAVIHIDIKGDKVWVQHDSTDAEIANELVERGIPQTQIVLGFQPAHRRQYTGFAAN